MPARSSTAAHYAANHINATVGKAENDFYGVPIVDNIQDAQPWQITILFIIAIFVVFQPSAFHKTKSASVTFWIVILAVSAATPETTLIPILSTIVHTRTSYPYIIVIPHCFIAAATYRSKHGDNVHYLQSLSLSFFLYGFGGSIVSDLLMGLPVTALSHPRIIPCYLIGWTLVWFSPFDVLFRKYSNTSSSLHYFLQACEAVDAVTTPMGRISRSARELRNKVTAPIAAGLLAGLGGGGLRHVVGESASIETLEVGFWRTLSYSVLWWWLAVRNCEDETYDLLAGNVANDEERQFLREMNNCQSYSGSDLVRVIIVGAHTCWMILVGTGIVKGHPLVWLCRNIILGRLGTLFARLFRMGPDSNNDIDNDGDDKNKSTNQMRSIKAEKKD